MFHDLYFGIAGYICSTFYLEPQLLFKQLGRTFWFISPTNYEKIIFPSFSSKISCTLFKCSLSCLLICLLTILPYQGWGLQGGVGGQYCPNWLDVETFFGRIVSQITRFDASVDRNASMDKHKNYFAKINFFKLKIPIIRLIVMFFVLLMQVCQLILLC